MKYDRLLEIVGQESVFHSSMLVAEGMDPPDLGKQLSRWIKSGKLIQLRRGLYTLSERYRKSTPHAFVVANKLKSASYVSLQSALEFYGLIPEYVPSITSVTTGRPEMLNTPLGTFIFRHIKIELFSDYNVVDLGNRQSAFVATPEKGLIDLLYLTPRSDDHGCIQELRLQNVEMLNADLLSELAEKSRSRKVVRAVSRIGNLIKDANVS